MVLANLPQFLANLSPVCATYILSHIQVKEVTIDFLKR